MTSPTPEPAATPQTLQPAGLARRLAALFYDLLLLFSVLMAASALALAVTGGHLDYHNPVYRTWMFVVSYLFYAWFWVHGGQTLGMRAWKIRVQRRDGSHISWSQALLRFLPFAAAVGLMILTYRTWHDESLRYFVAIPAWGVFALGYLWMLVDRDKLTWHDRYSETVVVRVPDPARSVS